MEHEEPEVFIVTEYTYFINYDTKTPRRNLASPAEIAKLVSFGYTVVDKREWYEYSEKLAIANERRHARNKQKRLRRARGSKE